MLTKFSVKSFKNFKDKIELNLEADNYEFNQEAIKNNHVKTGIIYGLNASGKTNLIYAIMDITTHLTDKNKTPVRYRHYLNMEEKNTAAMFEYQFKFNNARCVYTYHKADVETLLYEELTINDHTIFKYSHTNGDKELNLKGTETLDLNLDSKKLSFLKYTFKNAVYHNDPFYETLNQLEEFVEGMLTFNSIDGNSYQGFSLGDGSITEYIIENNHLEKFERFLKDSGIMLDLVAREIDGEKDIYVKFKNGGFAKFFTIASKGTRALALFYRWMIEKEKIKFLLIDEFDAYYHHDLSKSVLLQLRDAPFQSLVTTHNTAVMSNDILRPDCYFIIENKEVNSVANTTDKELRKAHNIEKMYRAGAFENE